MPGSSGGVGARRRRPLRATTLSVLALGVGAPSPPLSFAAAHSRAAAGGRKLDQESGQPVFDIADYSVKFERCERSGDQNIVAFRLCPDDCGDACSSHEYLLDMQSYLEAVLPYTQANQERYCSACKYCENASEDDDEGSLPPGCLDVDTFPHPHCITECRNIENMEENGYLDATEFVNINCQLIFDEGDIKYYAGAMCHNNTIRIGTFTDAQCAKYDETKGVLDFITNEGLLEFIPTAFGFDMKLSYHLLKQTTPDDGTCVASCDGGDEFVWLDDAFLFSLPSTNGDMCCDLIGAAYVSVPSSGDATAASVVISASQLHKEVALSCGLPSSIEDDIGGSDNQDITDGMSIRYEGCRRHTVMGEPNLSESTAIFRLCPQESGEDCTDCGASEYNLVALETYLDAVVPYLRGVQDWYCETCRRCTLEEDEAGMEEVSEMEGEEEEVIAVKESRFSEECNWIDTANCYEECEKIANMEANGYMEATGFVNCKLIHEDGIVKYYAGAMCDDDRARIKIGVFSDPQCSDLEEAKSVDDFLFDADGYGLKLSHNLLKQTYPGDGACVAPCSRSEGTCERLLEVSRECGNHLAGSIGAPASIARSWHGGEQEEAENIICDTLPSLESSGGQVSNQPPAAGDVIEGDDTKEGGALPSAAPVAESSSTPTEAGVGCRSLGVALFTVVVAFLL